MNPQFKKKIREMMDEHGALFPYQVDEEMKKNGLGHKIRAQTTIERNIREAGEGLYLKSKEGGFYFEQGNQIYMNGSQRLHYMLLNHLSDEEKINIKDSLNDDSKESKKKLYDIVVAFASKNGLTIHNKHKSTDSLGIKHSVLHEYLKTTRFLHIFQET